VIKGRVRVVFADHEESYSAGDVCYIAPGHRPVFDAHTEFVAFSLAESYRPVIEVVRQNLTALSQMAAR
jgi:quercetin dioxygenase-like cupin family protein